MDRGLLVLIPWMATLAAANPIGPRPAKVAFTFVGPLHERAWKIGEECYVPLAALKSFGWTYSLNGSAVEISAGSQQAKVGFRPGSALELVPLREAVNQLGGLSSWRDEGADLDVYGLLQRVALKDGKLTVASSLAAKPHVFALGSPKRLVVDLQGIQMGPSTVTDLPANARVGQFKADVVRIVIETDAEVPTHPTEAPTQAYALDISPATGRPRIDITDTPPPKTVTPTNTSPAPVTAGVVAGPVECVTDSDLQCVLRIPLKGRLAAPARFRRLDPGKLEVTLPGARYVAAEEATKPISSLSEVQARQEGGATILTVCLARPMGISLASLPAEVQISLYKPAVGNGKLAGKLIVVDPGHGGPDTGAKSLGGLVLEKDLNLKIGLEIADRLSAEGATVILTRKTDVRIPLRERSEIANRNGADLFVSVHINSNQLANSRSGNITFHHGGDPIGNVLAECIQREIGKSSGLPNLGVWSDRRIYSSGFAVLRYAKMPAVLLELGFINRSDDLRTMTANAFPQHIAEAVVRGLKVYLGDAKPQETLQ